MDSKFQLMLLRKRNVNKMNFHRPVEKVLFGSKWLLTFFYLGLIIGQICYAYIFAKEIYHVIFDLGDFTKETILITLLEIVDMVMIANLVKMIVTGSYNTSVSKEHGYPGENTSSGTMKVKMSTTLIGVTSIHLLQTFLNSNVISWEDIHKKLIIHGAFIVGSIALAYIEYLHDKGDALNPHDNDGIKPLPKH